MTDTTGGGGVVESDEHVDGGAELGVGLAIADAVAPARLTLPLGDAFVPVGLGHAVEVGSADAVARTLAVGVALPARVGDGLGVGLWVRVGDTISGLGLSVGDGVEVTVDIGSTIPGVDGGGVSAGAGA